MPVIRYMTPKEEDFWGPTVSGVVDEDILLSKKLSSPKTIRHEIGHIRFPVEIGEPLTPEYYVQYLFAELCAGYYSLSKEPRDKISRENIRYEKDWARKGGLTGEMVSRIDKVARERVGYTSKEVR